MKPGRKHHISDTVRAMAERWGVAISTVQHWRRRGWCDGDDMELARHLSTHARVPEIKAKARSVLAGIPLVETPKPVDLRDVVQSAAVDARMERKIGEASIDFITDLTNDYAGIRALIEAAKKANDWALVAELEERSHRVGKLIPEVQAKLKKIGEDRGEKIGKEELKRIAEVFANLIVIGGSKMRVEINKIGGKYGLPPEVVDELNAIAFIKVCLTPFIQSTHVPSRMQLPPWIGDIFKAAMVVDLEDGEKTWVDVEGKIEENAA